MKRGKNIKRAAISLMAIVAVVLWSDWASAQRQGGPARPARQTREFRGKERRGERAETETAATASAEINSKLQVILSMVNEGGRLEPKEIEIAKKTLLESRKYLNDFTEVERCEYYLLSAWMNYFAGYHRRALGEANKACKANPDDGDAMATQIALSMLNNEFQVVAELTKGQEEMTIFGAEGTSQGAGQEGRTGRILDFNLDFIKGGILGNKVSNLELACLNGSSLSYKADKDVVCLIIWKTETDESADTTTRSESFTPFGGADAPFGGMRGPRRGRTSKRTVEDSSEQMLAFSELFLAYYQNPRVRFAGVNIDSSDNKIKVMEALLENSWPWAQAMATEPANRAVSQFAELKLRQPTLVIAQPGGTVFYAGPASGFLPKMLLSQVSSEIEPTAGSKEAKTIALRRDAINPVDEQLQDLEQTLQDKPADWPEEVEEDEINPHAEDLYQMALVHQKSGRVLGYGRMVDYCRRIQELYPDSSQAQKAKELLRHLPKEVQKKYKVTDEEMGL